MGDIPTDMLHGAADEVLAILKTEELTDKDKKRDIEVLLDRLTDETFSNIVILGQLMVDYSPDQEYRDGREEEIEVNVELDEEDEDDDDNDELSFKADEEDKEP